MYVHCSTDLPNPRPRVLQQLRVPGRFALGNEAELGPAAVEFDEIYPAKHSTNQLQFGGAHCAC